MVEQPELGADPRALVPAPGRRGRPRLNGPTKPPSEELTARRARRRQAATLPLALAMAGGKPVALPGWTRAQMKDALYHRGIRGYRSAVFDGVLHVWLKGTETQ